MKFQELSYNTHNTFVKILCDKCSDNFVLECYITLIKYTKDSLEWVMGRKADKNVKILFELLKIERQVMDYSKVIWQSSKSSSILIHKNKKHFRLWIFYNVVMFVSDIRILLRDNDNWQVTNHRSQTSQFFNLIYRQVGIVICKIYM